ncbi:Hypothetical predicted protein [Mytilus galloprovincialis]|uniref:Endonuclease/exonuclease/phosphatase domain-containing protein n=1 Tax=Mytilus galloprovincialis TaxID=29158 RepID=A0A8B6D7G5_MYTGA|nr:Hypothetical predicted protein [Mytilus galloprovincialis]
MISLNVPGYKWIGHNRKNVHCKARRGSGGVGAFIRLNLYDSFYVVIQDRSVEGIMWICFKGKHSDFNFSVAICYLPPTDSSRPSDQEKFLNDLLQQVYSNQTKGYTIICGDFNARCGSNTDYIEGVDDIKPRTTIDTTENYNGDLFCEFLSDTNFAMLNGRIGINDFTYISPQGRSVVDYICVPYEQLESVLDFKIMRMSDVINTLNYNPESIPDHSLLSYDIKYPVNVDEMSNHYANEVKIKRNARKIPDDFLISDEVRHKVLDAIEKIEHSVYLDQNVQNAYDEFHKLIINEMETKLPLLQQKHLNKRSKSFYKPYWNQTLQTQWNLSSKEMVEI